MSKYFFSMCEKHGTRGLTMTLKKQTFHLKCTIQFGSKITGLGTPGFPLRYPLKFPERIMPTGLGWLPWGQNSLWAERKVTASSSIIWGLSLCLVGVSRELELGEQGHFPVISEHWNMWWPRSHVEETFQVHNQFFFHSFMVWWKKLGTIGPSPKRAWSLFLLYQ